MTIPDPMISTIAADLLTSLTIAAAEIPNPPTGRTVCLRPGSHVELLISQNEDECCSGLMWVRWARSYPSRRFPEPDSTVTPCDIIRWAVQFELGAVRCAPTPGPDSIPTCDQWIEVTVGVYDDGAAIRRAICRYADTHLDTICDEGRPLVTEGGCVGVAYLVTIGAPACDCPA